MRDKRNMNIKEAINDNLLSFKGWPENWEKIRQGVEKVRRKSKPRYGNMAMGFGRHKPHADGG